MQHNFTSLKSPQTRSRSTPRPAQTGSCPTSGPAETTSRSAPISAQPGGEAIHETPGDSVSIRSAKPPARSDKKRLVEKWMADSREQGIQQAVIIGGGPGGLAAAIALAKKNFDVTVIELRADENGQKPLHARPHQISLRQTSLDSLQELGAYNEVIAKSGFVEKESVLKVDETSTQVEKKTPEAVSVRRDGMYIHPGMLDTDSVSQVRISDVEKALYSEAQKLGVKVQAGHVAELRKSGESYSVSSHQAKLADNHVEKVGDSKDYGIPDIVIVADGAGSPTRQALGIGVKEESESKFYLGGHIQKSLGPQTVKVAKREGEQFTRHIMGTGHQRYDATWVSVEITPEEAKLSPRERTDLLAKKAQYIFPDQTVTSQDVGWGAGQLTTVQNRRAERTTAGDNVVLFGDSAGTGSVWVGGGLNLALTTHLKALEHLVDSLKTTRTGKARPLQVYDKTIQWATSRWHKAGADQLKSN